MLRLLNLCVVAALILAAAYVYKIKYDSTLKAELVAKKRAEIRQEREAIAILRAEWTKLDNPQRIEALAQRHLTLKPMQPNQIDNFDHLPARPPQIVPPDATDPIGALVETVGDRDLLTGTLPEPKR